MIPRAAEFLRGLRQPEPIVLVVVLLLVASALAFVEIADEVAERDTQTFDQWVLRGLRRADDPAVPIGPRWLGVVVRDFSGLGGAAVLILVTTAVAGFLLLSGQWTRMWLVLLAPGTGVLVSGAMKALFARPRPSVVPYLDTVSSASFPSGHSMMSAIVYLTLGTLLAAMVGRWRRKVYILSGAALVTFLVGCSRVFLGVHYPTDVLGGWVAGLAWALLCWLAVRLGQGAGKPE